MTSYLKKNVFSFLDDDDYAAKKVWLSSRLGKFPHHGQLDIKVYNVNGKNSDDQFNVFGWEGTWYRVEVVELQSPL